MLTSFSPSALIAAVATHLLPTVQVMVMWQVALWAVLGGVVFLLGERFMDRQFGTEGAGTRTARGFCFALALGG